LKSGSRTTEGLWSRSWDRREILKLGAFVAAGGSLLPMLQGCAPAGQAGSPSSSRSGTKGASPLSGPITVFTHSGDEGALAMVGERFRGQHPGIEWDIRTIPGGGPEWDRLARAAIASGEPVDLLTINGQQVRGWVRDGLLADLSAEPEIADVLARVPQQYHLTGAGEPGTRAFPLAVTQGVHTTGIFYNKAILDQAGLGPPRTITDLKAMVQPLAALDTSPMVHCSGDVFFNQILVTWLLPMIAERGGDPLAFAERTVRGELAYDGPEWIETFATIADLRASGVLLEGSGALDYAGMQQLFLQGRAATTFNGSWLLPVLQAGSPTAGFDLHIAPPPLVEGATRPRPILAWTGFALPAESTRSRDAVYAFLDYVSEPDVDAAVVADLQVYSPITESNVAIKDALAQEFLPMFGDAITPMDWLWEPEITAEIDNQVQALVQGATDPTSAATAVQAAADQLRSSGRSYYP
jgi:ABC-type glycerol-3-phosphate transport system substrate-binding protein